MNLQVTKLDGSLEPYSEAKIRSSATRVGVPTDLQDAMLKEIEAKLYDGIKTSEIFAIIRRHLAHSPQPYLAAKYNLKEALAMLGPSGYPFEQYLGQLLMARGYAVKTNELMRGKCVEHEVDVVAVKDGTTYLVEAKFHKKPAQRSDIKVALYIRARYEDISAAREDKTVPWIITNTRFTTDAVNYAACRDLKLTSWGYPRGEGIMDLIEAAHLHPITILDGLSRDTLELLFSQGIVVCRQLVDNKQAASLLPSSRRHEVLAQARAICQG